MIDAGFFLEDGGLRVVISGHANYSKGGGDIVCAAVSSIFFALAGYLLNLKESNSKLRRVEKGYAELTCNRLGEEAFRMACIGILQISEQYPDCVKVHNGIWRSRF